VGASPSQPTLWDACARKHKGNAQSRAANLRAESGKVTNRQRIYEQIAACGFAGATLKELKIAKGDRFLYPNELSPRITELVADELIFVSGRKRTGQIGSVYVADQWLAGSMAR
jgi:hypothetical protein